MDNIVSFYGSHDSSATFVDKEGSLRVLEYERLANIRYAAFAKAAENFEPVGTDDATREKFVSHINDNIKSEPTLVVSNACSDYDHNLIKKYWPNTEIKNVVIHHLAHAASAFYPSPFKKAAILSVDGVGEWTTTSIAKGENNSIEMLKNISFPHSLGLLYSAFTYYCGFRVNSGEYKLMGLAPYGNGIYKDKIKSISSILKRMEVFSSI